MDNASRAYLCVGHDEESLLFNLMDEFLFQFATEGMVCRDVCIESVGEGWTSARALGRGEKFDRSKHTQGTEVKAITYSAMKIAQGAQVAEVFVIVDI